MPAPLTAPPKRPPRRRAGQPPAAGGGLGAKRIAGVPAPVLVVGLVIAVGVGLYLRSGSANASSGQTASPATGTQDTGAGGASGSADQTGQATDYTAFEDLAFALNGLTGVLGGGQFASGITSGPAPFSSSSASAPAFPTPLVNDPNFAAFEQSIGFSPSNAAPTKEPIVNQLPASLNTRAQTIPDAPHTAATNVQPFGGVVSTKTLKNGATLQTYASGRQVEQAKEKTAYVVHK